MRNDTATVNTTWTKNKLKSRLKGLNGKWTKGLKQMQIDQILKEGGLNPSRRFWNKINQMNKICQSKRAMKDKEGNTYQ